MNLIKSFLLKIQNTLFLNKCLFCKKEIKNEFLCIECFVSLPFHYNCCNFCATNLDSFNFYCKFCVKYNPPYTNIFIPFIYQSPIKDFIKKIKRKQKIPQLFYLSMLTKLAIQNLPNIFYEVDYIIPVPSIKEKVQERRFNHTLEIAKIISNKTKIQIFKDLDFKKNVIENKRLNYFQRFQNRKESFFIKNHQQIKDKKILIIDDVVTTGSTIINLTNFLLSKQIQSVYVFAIAKVNKQRNF